MGTGFWLPFADKKICRTRTILDLPADMSILTLSIKTEAWSFDVKLKILLSMIRISNLNALLFAINIDSAFKFKNQNEAIWLPVTDLDDRSAKVQTGAKIAVIGRESKILSRKKVDHCPSPSYSSLSFRLFSSSSVSAFPHHPVGWDLSFLLIKKDRLTAAGLIFSARKESDLRKLTSTHLCKLL